MQQCGIEFDRVTGWNDRVDEGKVEKLQVSVIPSEIRNLS